MINETMNISRVFWALLPAAIIMGLAAWLRGAEYDEQYTLFLTAGAARPDWPTGVFSAGLAHTLQSGHAGPIGIGMDLRGMDVHPPLYFWLAALWRAVFGDSLFVARLFSVAAGLGTLAVTGMIARRSGVSPNRAILITLGCYGFAYTAGIARGFALAELSLMGGVLCLLWERRARFTLTAGALFGLAVLTNYLAAFVVLACLLMLVAELIIPTWHNTEPGPLIRRSWATAAALVGFSAFLPAILWWFLAQKGSRDGQFPPFSVLSSLVRLARSMGGAIMGGLPLYVEGIPSTLLIAALGIALAAMAGMVVWHWRGIGDQRARCLFAMGAAAPGLGLLILGAVFNNTPIEVRYLSFAMPFVGLLLAGALTAPMAGGVLAVQAVSIAGLLLAPQTMQPARAAARAAAALADGGVVFLPRGNDGVGVVGAFAIEAPPELPLLLIKGTDTTDSIRAKTAGHRRIVVVPLMQDDDSRIASTSMLAAFADPAWREVGRHDRVLVFERNGPR